MKRRNNAKPKEVSLPAPSMIIQIIHMKSLKCICLIFSTNHPQKRDLLMTTPEFNLVRCYPPLPRCLSPDLYLTTTKTSTEDL